MIYWPCLCGEVEKLGGNLTGLQTIAVAAQFGITLAVSVGLGIFIGTWLDSRLGTGMLMMFIGLFAGLIGATLSVVQMLKHFAKRNRS
jgi:F0F1-type ATP synthase assembly protein I